jgi:hypothetical protein
METGEKGDKGRGKGEKGEGKERGEREREGEKYLGKERGTMQSSSLIDDVWEGCGVGGGGRRGGVGGGGSRKGRGGEYKGVESRA